MLFIILIGLPICALITYFWIFGSHIYIDLSRSYAASSYPGDITFSERIVYQLFFPATLFVISFVIIFILFLIFKNKMKFSSSVKKFLFLILIPLICTISIFIDLYIFLFVNFDIIRS